MTALPLMAYWSLALWGLFARRPVLLYLMVISLPFGSLAVVPPGLSGGLTLLPAAMTGVLICLRQFLLRRSGLSFLASSVARWDRGAPLFLFWVVAVVATIFAPRIFAGRIVVVPLRGTGAFMETAWLYPSTQNISQLAYLTVSVALTFALFHLLRREDQLAHLSRAWLWGGAVTVLTGMLDLMSQSVPIGPLLAPFRTATYSDLTEVVLSDGAKRVVGLTPEASAYGAICMTFLGFLWFLRHAFPARGQRRLAILLSALLLLFAILSTSSAAYVGIAILAALAAAEWLWRAGRLEALRGAGRTLPAELLAAIGGVLLLGVLLIAAPRVLDPVVERIDEMVFSKVDSASYEERSAWTRVAFEAGMSSYLLGVGAGSTRSSNAAVAVFAATGLLGALLYYGFVLQCMLRPVRAGAEHLGQGMVRAARWSFVPAFVLGLMIGTSPDFGVSGAIRWAIILAVCAERSSRRTGGSAFAPVS